MTEDRKLRTGEPAPGGLVCAVFIGREAGVAETGDGFARAGSRAPLGDAGFGCTARGRKTGGATDRPGV